MKKNVIIQNFEKKSSVDFLVRSCWNKGISGVKAVQSVMYLESSL